MAEHEPEAAWASLGGAEPPALAPIWGEVAADACVVGLGASGLTAAARLAERGADVVALDARGVAAGAAGRNGGFLLAGLPRFHHDAVASYGRERAATLYRLTLDELGRTLDELPDGIARRVGSVRIADSDAEATDCERQLTALRADGLPAEAYDGPEGRGLLVPTDAAFNPAARCAWLAEGARRAGARLHAPCPVDEVAPGAVRAGPATVRAPRVIVAVDGGLEELLPALAGRVRTTRLQMLATAADDAVSVPRPVYRRWGYDYYQQLPSGEVLLGGCRDQAEDEEWGAPAVPTERVQKCLNAELRRLGARAPVTHRWAGRAAFTDDDLPVCQELMPGVLVVGAYSGHGNLLGTWCARAAADAALDRAALRLPGTD